MNDYEHKAINACVEPVLMALAIGATYDALSKEPRHEPKSKRRTVRRPSRDDTSRQSDENMATVSGPGQT